MIFLEIILILVYMLDSCIDSKINKFARKIKIIPVSYTHLDVYKRQVSSSVKRAAFSADATVFVLMAKV